MSDYIDRQEYIAAFDYPEPEFFDDFRAGRIYGLNRAEVAVRKAPAAAVAPVVHGRWEWDTGDIYRCSACGEKTHVKEVMGRPDWGYCPVCGAKMDEGRGQDER